MAVYVNHNCKSVQATSGEIETNISVFSLLFDFFLLPQLECKVRPVVTPPSRYHSISQSLETTMSDLGYCDPSMTASLRRVVTDTAQACLKVVMETESKMSARQRGGMYAQSDVIGE